MSPYNFDIVLLDHGLYFDLDDDLRVNYSRFWLSLIGAASPQTNADRRKYAKLVGNINDDLVCIHHTASCILHAEYEFSTRCSKQLSQVLITLGARY